MIFITSASGRQWQTEDPDAAATFVAECGFTYSDARATNWTQKSSHDSCTVGEETDEDGYVECDECGMMWPSENDA